VIVQQGSDTRLVQPGVFRNTYTHPDGSEIALDEVPVAGDACQDVSGCRHM